MPKSGNSKKIHLRIGQRNLWNFPAQSSYKGWIKSYSQNIINYLNPKFRAKDSGILNKMAGTSPTRVP
jgi:hypothetical protein